jgi:integrase
MPRPPLPIGTWGKISSTTRAGVHTATARFRDFDGVTRQVERTSYKSKGNAENLLREALNERMRPGGDELTPESSMLVAGTKWWKDEIEGQLAFNTERRYNEVLAVINHGLGGMRLREVTTSRVDSFLRTIASTRGAATAKVAKTVLNGVLGMAARLGAIESNPTRDVGRIKKPSKEVRALTLDQLRELRTIIEEVERDTHGDLWDPMNMMMGTGARIGEVFAFRRDDLNLTADAPTVTVAGTTLWKKGEGMSVQAHPKSSASRRTLILPPFVVDILTARGLDGEMLFPSLRGTVRDPNNFRKQWRNALAGTEFEWVTPHTFRKSVATLLDDVGDASSQLGHSGTHITETHYRARTHAAPDLRSQLQAIGEPAVTQRKQPKTARIDGINRELSRSETAS